MWYRQAQKSTSLNNFGGGAMRSKTHQPQKDEKLIWDALVKRNNQMGTENGEFNETTTDINMSEGPITKGIEMRRLSPYHDNPENTTLENQLETARLENINVDPESMSQRNLGTGEMLIRGIDQYNSGKGWVGFQGQNPSTIKLV